MDNILLLILLGLVVGTFGTLIGAGGGFLLVPILLFTHPALPPGIVTAISMAIVAANAISGSIAYARSGRIDFRAGLLFAICTVPGSVLGVVTTRFIPLHLFHLIFGILLIVLALFLFLSGRPDAGPAPHAEGGEGVEHALVDASGQRYTYRYKVWIGVAVSIVVGYLSPLLGIGGGIIHVPAMINWLHFPVHIATATSHFVLAVMSTVSVVTHWWQGSYDDPAVQRMTIALCVGAVGGAQIGALLSQRVKGNVIVRALAVCLAVVGVRILLTL